MSLAAKTGKTLRTERLYLPRGPEGEALLAEIRDGATPTEAQVEAVCVVFEAAASDRRVYLAALESLKGDDSDDADSFLRALCGSVSVVDGSEREPLTDDDVTELLTAPEWTSADVAQLIALIRTVNELPRGGQDLGKGSIRAEDASSSQPKRGA